MRVIRIATVGLGVTLGCVLAGAVAGVLSATIIGMVIFGPREFFFSDVGVWEFAASIGGCWGLVVGPLAAFGFLRRVPLGLLFVETALGATLGGVLGYTLAWHSPYRITGIVAAAVAGFAVAVAHLAWRYRASRAEMDTVIQRDPVNARSEGTSS